MASSSQPVAISRPPRPAPPPSKPQQVGCSPPGPSSYTPGGICFPPSIAPMMGSSPPSSSSFKSRSTEKLGPYAAAKKFWNRLIHDSSLIPDEYTVRFIDNVQQQERKSGAEAWSLRVQDKVLELPYVEFAARYASDIPFHRILSYRHGATVIWESDFHRAHATGSAVESSPGSGTFGSSFGNRGISTPLRERSGNVPIHQMTGFLGSSFCSTSNDVNCGDGGPSGLVRAGSGSTTAMSKLSLAVREGSCSSSRGCSPGPLRSSGGGCSPNWARSRSSSVEGATPEGNSSAGSDTEAAGQRRSGGSSTPLPQCTGTSLGTGLLWQELGGQEGMSSLEEAATQLPEVEEPPHEIPSLPEQCWLTIMRQLGVREVCMMARVSKSLRLLSTESCVWRDCYATLFGKPSHPDSDWGTVRRECRRSELRAARWMEAEVQGCSLGPISLQCLQMDESKVVSGGGNEVRLWSHEDGRKIATLKGHQARVTCVSFDQHHIISGCAGSLVKVWGMDDLKLRRTLRGHDGPITATATFNSIPLSASKDGAVKLWDMDKAQPILALAAPGGAYAMAADEDSGYLVTAGRTISIYDMTAAQLLHTLEAPPPPHRHRHHSSSNGHHAHALADAENADEDDEEDEQLLWLASEGVAAPDGMGGGGSGGASDPFTCVSYSGKLLAAGRAGGVVLWDPRSTQVVAQLDAAAVAAAVRPITTAAAAATATPSDFHSSSPSIPTTSSSSPNPHTPPPHSTSNRRNSAHDITTPFELSLAQANGSSSGVNLNSHTAGPARCIGVQLDEWKLVVGFQDGSNSLTVHDTRAVSGRASGGGSGSYGRGAGVVRGWETPVQIMTAPSQINSFQFHGELLLAGLDSGADCVGWRFVAPAHTRPAAGDGLDGNRGGGGLGKKEKKKPPKIKQPMRFPKRQY